MKRLNIFVDETGDFGYGKKASRLYGVSFTFHEQENDIELELNKLNERLKRIGYSGMIHMADLIMKRGDYKEFDIKKRKSIFNAFYQFAKRVPIQYTSLFIDKKYADDRRILKKQLIQKIYNMISKHEDYFKKFDKIVMYYDNGQGTLCTILENAFLQLENFKHCVNFNHEEKRLFQISDMLTYIDKYDYKYKNKIEFTHGEKYFFSFEEIRKTLKELDVKRF